MENEKLVKSKKKARKKSSCSSGESEKDITKKNTVHRNYVKELFENLSPEKEIKKESKQIIYDWIESTKNDLLKKTSLDYNVIIQYDKMSMHRSDADKIYSAAKDCEKSKDILLVLFSTGGDVSSAYLISKLCREYTKDKFVVVIPRLAKSAATLVCCGADEIHMGSLSELGPIDPQINHMPALGLKNAVRQIAEMTEEFPTSGEMFARYLNETVRPIDIGYYNRVVESAAQYAERLLRSRGVKAKDNAKLIANHLVYTYKDHGFVIDKNEAIDIFGSDVIKTETDEYQFGYSIYSTLSTIEKICGCFDKAFYYIGNNSDGVGLFHKGR